MGEISESSITEYSQLLYSSGVMSSLTGRYYATDGFNNIRYVPLYLIRGGEINSDNANGRLSNIGGAGGYWTSTVIRSTNAYHLYFLKSTVNPTDKNFSGGIGWFVRCLAR